MLSINTNLSSLIVQSNLKLSTNGLNTAIERMTAGFKINHAKDNAANFSINTKISSKLSSYYVAQDNASMGLDMMTCAMDSLDLISSHLSRIRDLAEQSANGTYGENSLKAIRAEVNARADEILQLYQTTNYNGIRLFGEFKEPKYIEEVTVRETESMVSLESVDANQTLVKGVYSISTAEELVKLAGITNNGLLTEGSEFVLADNIDLAAYSNWTPIGNNTNRFKGTFDGNGYSVQNLHIDNELEDYQGLFGFSIGKIQNLGLENVNITGHNSVGAIVGNGYYTGIINCYVSGKVNGNDNVGAVAGSMDHSAVDYSYSDANVFASGNTVGGLVGNSYHSGVSSSFFKGDVSGNIYVGGLVGTLHDGSSQIIGSFSIGNNVKANNYAGGIVGYVKNARIVDSYSEECSISCAKFAGAAVGNFHNGTIINSYSIADTLNDFIGNYSSGTVDSASGILSKDAVRPFEYNYLPDVNKTLNDVIFQVGLNADEGAQIVFNTSFMLENIESLRKIGLNNINYLDRIDSLLKTVFEKQTAYGSAYNRLESTLETIGVSIDNLISTQSTIRDADIAKESSAYIRYQILQEASASLLATANQTPAIALQLL